MSRKTVQFINIALSYFSIAQARVHQLDCRDCGAGLDIHQPNPNQPDQFLGTCNDCGAWFRIDGQAEGGKALVIRLPEAREVRHGQAVASETP